MSSGERATWPAELGGGFRDARLLRLALTHPSVAHERGGAVQHNQRLEFLGDAVLQLILTRELYERFPALNEGALTKARARLVNRRHLGEQARRLGLGAHLVLSHGEEAHGGRERGSTLADAFEALVGAIYLDGGWEAARQFVLRHLGEGLANPEGLSPVENPKGELQELLQASAAEAPQYRLETSTGPDHDRCFVCAVYHQGVELGRGSGRSKQAAQTEAAHAALRRLRETAQTLNLNSSTSPSRTT
jgi:ribonuclease-3